MKYLIYHRSSKYKALVTSFFILLHILWSIIAFGAFEKKEYKLIAWVSSSHLIASLAVRFYK